MRKIKLLSIFIIFVFVFWYCISNVVYAEEDFKSKLAEILKATNTYDVEVTEQVVYDTNNSNTPYNYYKATYNMQETNDNAVSDDAPQVTFLTHGLEGDASHWSNDKMNGIKKFIYTNDSIVELLCQKSECNIYVFEFKNVSSYKIMKYIKDGNCYISEEIKSNSIEDNSKHSIVIFNAYKSSFGNEYIYSQFNIMVSSVLNDLMILNGDNKIPRINLIGHSRGGITNLQYALDHPDIVDSIFSLGTPYLGSTTASIDNLILDGKFTDNSLGEDDITNSEIYMDYLERWNTNYDKLYKNIKVHAIGGYSSLDTLIFQLIYSILPEYKGSDVVNEVIENILKLLNIYVSYKLNNTLSIGNKQEFISYILDLIYYFFPEIQTDNGALQAISSVLNLLFDELQYNPLTFSYDLHNDGLVDLPSQLGYDGQSSNSYIGFKKYKVRISMEDTYSFNKVSSLLPPVVHNLEARNLKMLTYIVKNIELSQPKNPKYLVNIVDNTSVSIVGYLGENTNELNIPSTIYYDEDDGDFNNNTKTVVEIGEGAFAEDFNGNDQIEKVTIPDTVKIIRKNAFINNSILKEVVFSKESQLTKIESNAFSNIPNLNSFTIPSGVTIIEQRAFENSGITSFVGNNNYEWKNNLLINKNVYDTNNLVAIYANPEVEDVVVPDNVTILSTNLFYRNQNIKTIDLNDVTTIEKNAFSYSSLEYITNSTNIQNVDSTVFMNTPWLLSQEDDFKILGQALLFYSGDCENVVVPNGIVRIGTNAFIDSNIKTVILPESINSIGRKSFEGCSNLEWILIDTQRPPVLDGDCFDSNIILYVRYGSLDAFLLEADYQFIENDILAKEVEVDFYDSNGNYLSSEMHYYYSAFETEIKIEPENGKEFVCWIDNDGNKVYENYHFLYFDDVVLTSYFEDIKYHVTLNSGNNQEELIITYGQTVDLGAPEELGKEFIGWYDSPNGGEMIIDSSGIGIWNRTDTVEHLYARFIDIVYTVSYEIGEDEEFVNDNSKKTFTISDPLLDVDISEIRKFGYVFDKWVDENGNEFKTSSGYYDNIVLYPKWFGEYFVGNPSISDIIGEYVVIDLSSAVNSVEYVFYINSNVKSVTFIGHINRIFSKMRIVVKSGRNMKLVMGFYNMNFQPPVNSNGNGYNAISVDADVLLEITYKGTNKITGGTGRIGVAGTANNTNVEYPNDGLKGNTGGAGCKGGDGVHAFEVYLNGYNEMSSISIYGGKGGIGGKGGRGQNGLDGITPPNGSFVNPNAGDSGTNGGEGGTGGEGGSGGYAIYVKNKVLRVTENSVFELFGGDGGSGGAGGIGGTGGKGTDDVSANIFNGVGDPGNGGNGGRGGKGGRGGDGCLATNVTNIKGTGGKGGIGGAGGAGGSGGAGGDAGAAGENGQDGNPGKPGDLGIQGDTGTDGGNSYAYSSGYINLEYSFSRKNFDIVQASL